jgi:hypothetical protein
MDWDKLVVLSFEIFMGAALVAIVVVGCKSFSASWPLLGLFGLIPLGLIVIAIINTP